MISSKDVKKLQLKSIEIKKSILSMAFRAKAAHVGGALSCADLLTVLYFRVLNVNPSDPFNKNRDMLIFSKAHDAKALYATLAERGFFPKKILEKYEVDDAVLPGHATRFVVPGVEASAGSLGHGLSMAAGVALAAKLSKAKYKTLAVLSDGECDEGSTWEAILFAGHHKLDNLTAIVDYNKLQGFGFTKDILNLEPFAKKWQSFGWVVKEIDGHNIKQIAETLSKVPFQKEKPSVVIAHTIKGKDGVPMHINQISSQYKSPTQEELKKAIDALNKHEKRIS
jgi:transketolase